MSDDIRNQLIEGTADIIEVFVDAALQEGILKDIPLLGTAIHVAGIGRTMRDRVFLETVKRFLLALPKIPEQKRQAFIAQLREDEKISGQGRGGIISDLGADRQFR